MICVGLRLLVRNEAALGQCRRRLCGTGKSDPDVKGPEATADDHALLADLMIAAAGGYVSTEAEAALRMALQRDPGAPDLALLSGLYPDAGGPARCGLPDVGTAFA